MLLVFTGTGGALTFDNKRNGMWGKALWQMDRRNRRVLEAERLLACLAIEMEMSIGMMTLALMVVAKFVVKNTTPVLKRMHHILLGKEGQYTEYTRFIEREHFVLHITQTHGTPQLHECLIDKNTIDGRLNSFLFKEMYGGLCVHGRKKVICKLVNASEPYGSLVAGRQAGIMDM